jgi:hypothetical protein
MGCVNWSMRFFRGEVTRESMERARIAARLEVQTLERRYRSLGWEECVGSSGTVLSTAAVPVVPPEAVPSEQPTSASNPAIRRLPRLIGIASVRISVVSIAAPLADAAFRSS